MSQSEDDIKSGEEKELQISPEEFFCSLKEAKAFGQKKEENNNIIFSLAYWTALYSIDSIDSVLDSFY